MNDWIEIRRPSTAGGCVLISDMSEIRGRLKFGIEWRHIAWICPNREKRFAVHTVLIQVGLGAVCDFSLLARDHDLDGELLTVVL